MHLGLGLNLTRPIGGFNPQALFADGSIGTYYDPSDLSTLFQDAAGTTPANSPGDPVALVLDKSGNGHHAFQDTNNDFRPTLQQDDSGDWILQNDEIDDALAVTFPNMGTDCTVAYVTQSEVRLDEGVTLNGAYTLPQNDLLGFVAIDRELTTSEKIGTILYLASKAQGVNYGASIDDMTLACLNAVDVFVYDTSKDSDGGAWRTGALAQASSWYNETLNTATRGSRREFPAVAVIVAEATKVTIYDGDDPALPMWMVFEGATPGLVNGPYIYAGGTRTLSSVYAENSMFAVGTVNSSGAGVGLIAVSFAADEAVNYYRADVRKHAKTISGRNVTEVDGGYIVNTSLEGIVNSTVNDVAMTVLPDAPTDPATGLPVPTIAVATDGGVSVITDSGAVYDSSYTASVADVGFWEDGTVVFGRKGFTVVAIKAEPSDYQSGDGFGTFILHGGLTFPTYFPYQSGTLYLPFGENEVAGGNPSATSSQFSIPCLGRYFMGSTALQSMGCVITSTYNTGWMNGDIKGAFLADTDDTDLVGSGELVTNGTFDTDVSGWTFEGTATDSSAAGYLEGTTGGATNNLVYTTIATEIGKTYIASVDNVGVSGFVAILAGGSAFSSTRGISGYVSSDKNASLTFTATATTTYISIRADDANRTVRIDNISVKLADADRSVNNNGLIVNGTVTRSAVATGAELVAYSGFSASNYLEQPYNPDLDFGTGDFCVMGWVKVPNAVSSFRSFERNLLSAPNAYKRIVVNVTGGLVGAYAGGAAITSAVSANTWNYVVAVRSAGVFSLFVNGSLKATQSNALDVSLADAITRLGSGVQYAGADHSLALWRISATAPTADQIRRIYEDEKVLFQENAACTLYGSSDAVTALAHDSDTDLLHVGTSDGRSVFRGLERIQNTTTSVSKAISAAGGLIAEK